ncbi:unnamed protein product [Peronospora belbahrii]|uniref:Uncharacterized protein n=1 Tax=Peronospora belbahrii TaxID=622444 RepID=A0ABN8DAI7_9STRA|nr:unnamed protein product [Peronospora belbahrii]
MVFNSDAERSRRTIEPMLFLKDGSDADDEHHSDWSVGFPSLKRARIDEEGFLAEAVLAYAASIDGVPETPKGYVEAITSDEAAEWRQAIDAELQSHARNQTWTLVPLERLLFQLDAVGFLQRNATRAVELSDTKLG